MKRTTTREVKANIRDYIMAGYSPVDYGLSEAESFHDAALTIYNVFKQEKQWEVNRYPEQNVFESWCAGLPSIIDTCYYYNRSAVDDVCKILCYTEAEKAVCKYGEQEAEHLLSWLIYREITAEVRKQNMKEWKEGKQHAL